MARVATKHAPFSFRRLGRRFFLLVNAGVALVFLLACLHPWLSPINFWFIGYLSIAFPYILLVLFIFLLVWVFMRPRYMLVSLVAMLAGYKQISFLFALHSQPFTLHKQAGDLRVMTWNIMSFAGFDAGTRQRELNADRIFALIRRYNPDIICLQEYGQFEDKKLGRSYLELMENMGYAHEVLSRDYSRKVYSYSSGLAIFSKYPVVKSKRIPYRSSAESMLYADVQVNSDTIRIFNTHLQSYRFSTEELAQVDRIKSTEKPMFRPFYSLLNKMKRAFRNRGAQVDQAVPVIAETTLPSVICLDMNDVPNSYAYWKLRGNRHDVFLEKGFGIGRTYISILPTLRIDYIFPDQVFKVKQMKILPERYSDHLPVIADLQLQK